MLTIFRRKWPSSALVVLLAASAAQAASIQFVEEIHVDEMTPGTKPLHPSRYMMIGRRWKAELGDPQGRNPHYLILDVTTRKVAGMVLAKPWELVAYKT